MLLSIIPSVQIKLTSRRCLSNQVPASESEVKELNLSSLHQYLVDLNEFTKNLIPYEDKWLSSSNDNWPNESLSIALSQEEKDLVEAWLNDAEYPSISLALQQVHDRMSELSQCKLEMSIDYSQTWTEKFKLAVTCQTILFNLRRKFLRLALMLHQPYLAGEKIDLELAPLVNFLHRKWEKDASQINRKVKRSPKESSLELVEILSIKETSATGVMLLHHLYQALRSIDWEMDVPLDANSSCLRECLGFWHQLNLNMIDLADPNLAAILTHSYSSFMWGLTLSRSRAWSKDSDKSLKHLDALVLSRGKLRYSFLSQRVKNVTDCNLILSSRWQELQQHLQPITQMKPQVESRKRVHDTAYVEDYLPLLRICKTIKNRIQQGDFMMTNVDVSVIPKYDKIIQEVGDISNYFTVKEENLFNLDLTYLLSDKKVRNFRPLKSWTQSKLALQPRITSEDSVNVKSFQTEKAVLGLVIALLVLFCGLLYWLITQKESLSA